MKLTTFTLTFALTAVLGIPVNANPTATRRAPARTAARSAPRTAARTNTARPAGRANTSRPAARQNTARTNAPRSNATRQNTARTNQSRPGARPNTAHTNTSRTNTAKQNTGHTNTAHQNAGQQNGGRQNAAHGNNSRNGGGTRNASYNRGNGDPLHGGRHIPDGRFRASFGRGHEFHIGHPIMIGGLASFQFGGFWFGIVDPWPSVWLYSDPVYVDYVDGGYVLVNVWHPGIEVAVSAGDPVNSCTASVSPAPLAQTLSGPAGGN
jgi:hypothetical protein